MEATNRHEAKDLRHSIATETWRGIYLHPQALLRVFSSDTNASLRRSIHDSQTRRQRRGNYKYRVTPRKSTTSSEDDAKMAALTRNCKLFDADPLLEQFLPSIPPLYPLDSCRLRSSHFLSSPLHHHPGGSARLSFLWSVSTIQHPCPVPWYTFCYAWRTSCLMTMKELEDIQ